MEKRVTGKIGLSVVLCGMCIMLAGCSDNLETAGAGGQDTVQTGGGQAQVNLSEQEQQILQYEIKYSSGEFEPADYLTLAELYGSQGRVKEQRDMLEQSWRLYEDEAAFSALAEITVNVEEEDEDIRSQAKLIMQKLELEEYHNEAVNLVNTGEWFSIMMPKLYEGQRNYYLEADSTQHKLQIRAGYDEAGIPFSEIWFMDGTGQVLYLKKEGDTVRMLMTGLAEGLYQGAFDSWLCIGTTGDIYHEQGTFSQGVCVGEYTADVYFGKGSIDLYTLWYNREGMEFTTYKGEFDRNGKTLLEQPSPAALETVRGTAEDSSVIIYAYDEKEKKFLFIRVPEAEEAVFDVSALGIRALPSYTPYEIYTAPAAGGGDGQNGNGQEGGGDGQNGNGAGQDSSGSGNVSGSQTGQEATVRIYDGNIEWFDGQVWRVLGSVETYQEKDPFLIYEQERKEQTGGEGSTGAGGESSEGEGTISSGTGSIYDRQGAGTIEEPKSPAKPNKNNNSGSSNSGQTQKSDTGNTSGSIDNSGSGGSTGGGGDSGSSGGSGGSTGGGDDSGSSGGSGGSTGGDSGSSGSGGDVDVEWTPDIL